MRWCIAQCERDDKLLGKGWRRTDSWLKNGGLRTDLLDGASLVKLAGSSTLLYEKTTAISAWAALFALLGPSFVR